MKKFLNIFKISDLRQKIAFTGALLLVYRLGGKVPVPGVDKNVLQSFMNDSAQNSLLGLYDTFVGGFFSQASIFTLGIMPYISASIIIQLLGSVVPYFQKLQSEGESGRRKISNITRYLTIVITAGQAPGYIANLKNTLPETAFLLGDGAFWFSSINLCISDDNLLLPKETEVNVLINL